MCTHTEVQKFQEHKIRGEDYRKASTADYSVQLASTMQGN